MRLAKLQIGQTDTSKGVEVDMLLKCNSYAKKLTVVAISDMGTGYWRCKPVACSAKHTADRDQMGFLSLFCIGK
jgi:hypothetical protein